MKIQPMKKPLITLILFCIVFQSQAQIKADDIRRESEKYLKPSLDQFIEFLKIPNNGNYPDQILDNLKWSQSLLEGLGFQTQIVQSGNIPHLFAQGAQDPTKKTILVYMQIDGQPADPKAWNQPNPYIPVLKENKDGEWNEISMDHLQGDIDLDWKIFARSASDSKGPANSFFSALQIMKAQNWEPAVNLKMILDFQEELSSPELADVVAQNNELFAADGILIMDGTRHLSNLPNLTFGARGIATATIKVFGASRDLHSGQYGNFAPNPVFSMARLLAAMKDEDGKVLIPGFYDGVNLTEEDIKAMALVPETLEEIEDDLGIAEAEKVGNTYQEALQYPSLNVRGINAAWVGKEVRTLIPSVAVAELDLRLVKETPGERQLNLLKDFIEGQGYHLIEGEEPTDAERKTYKKLASFTVKEGSEPFRTDMNSDFAHWLEAGMRHVFGDNFINTRQTGGSQPMAPFINILDAPAVSVRIPNPDNSIHAPNENIRIGNYLEGIETCLSILTQRF